MNLPDTGAHGARRTASVILEELRDELSDSLPAYERSLRSLVRAKPDWLDVSADRVHTAFRFPEESATPRALIGPRIVALAAAEIDAFAARWSDPSAPDALERARDAGALERYLLQVEREAQAVAIAGRATLQSTRDEILAALEDRRVADVEAIEARVSSGELERGGAQRREIAEIWEGQRRRASALQAYFDPLLDAMEDGLDATEAGLDALRAALRAARDPSPSAPEPPPLESSDPLDEARQGALNDFDPYGSTSGGARSAAEAGEPDSRALYFSGSEDTNDDLIFASDDEPEGPLIDFDEEESAPSQIFATEVGRDRTGQVPAGPSAYDVFLSDDSSETDQAAGPTIPQAAGFSIEEAGPTEPSARFERPEPRPAPPDDAPLPSAPRDPEPVLEAAPPAQAPPAPKRRPPAPPAPPAPASAQPKPAPAAPRSAPRPVARERVVGRCFQVRAGFAPVSRAGFMLVLGAPILIAAALLMANALSSPGAGPLATEAGRWLAGCALGWMAIAPIALGWRVAWRGWSPRLLRRAAIRRDASIVERGEALEVGPERFVRSELCEVSRERWESSRDRTRGWLLSWRDRRGAVHFFVAPTRDARAWERAPLALGSAPNESWQCDEPTWRALEAWASGAAERAEAR